MDIHASLNVLSRWPLEWSVLGIFLLIVSAENVRAGTNKATSLALALPLAYLLFGIAQHAAGLQTVLAQLQGPAAQAALFGALTMLSYLFVHRAVSFFGTSSAQILPALLAGIATTVIVLVFWMQVAALDSIWRFSAQIQSIFGETYRFWWLLAAYLLLALARS